LVEGNNPSQNNFPGSDVGTDVELEPGAYNVTEEGLETPTPHVCSREGFEAGSSFGDNLFICTDFSDECDGDITPGSTKTCEITNALVFCEVDEFDPIRGFNEPKDIAYDPVHEEMYVVNQGGNNVIRIDTTSDPPAIVGSPITVGSNPFGIGYDPEHFNMYVSNGEGGATTVSVINTNTNAVITTIDLGAGNGPFEFAYDPINDEMYVTEITGNQVFRIDAAANPPVLIAGSITVGNIAWGIEYDPINQEMYVTNFGDGTVSRIDTTQSPPVVIGSAITVGAGPTDITYDPDLKRMYVTNFSGGTVSVIDTTTNTVITTITHPSFDQPVYVTYDPVCKDMYVTNQNSNTVSIIDTTTNTVIDTFTVGPNPIGIAYDPVEHRMFVANTNFSSPTSGTVSIINLCGCPPFDEGTDSNGSIFPAQASLLQENSLTANVTPGAEIPTISENTSPSSFSPPSVPTIGDSSEALAKITKLKQQWLDLLP
jgi:YVTN family beta-propeller protein